MIYIAAAILILLILSAFFSGSETALTASSRPLMHQLEKNGNPRAALVNRLQQKKDRLIGTLLVGNNLVNILASALATSLLMGLFGEAGVAIATVVMTLLVLIFSEIMPKTYAYRHANRVALLVAPPINVIMTVFTPFVRTVNWVVRVVLRLFGADPHSTDTLYSPEDELRGVIELHTTESKGEARESSIMLRSVLDLQDVQVGEIMTHRKDIDTINADMPVDDAIALVLNSAYTRIPLWRENPDNVVGILHAKALLREVRAQDGNLKKLKDLNLVAMAATPWFIPEQTLLLDQLQAFRDRHEHFALVVDEYGSLMGIVTLEDILEEIVGDISDETDVQAPGVNLHADGSVIVQGDVTIRDLNRQLDWELPDEEASTIAGLVLHESRRIPEVGQTYMFYGFRFEVLRRRRHQITAIRISPPKPDPNDA
ncbi:MAG: HlyC/CorC family transporter [Rhodospirillales bacterium]|nr:HlyC/CorC family transporter [Rhodospirillales bacterium]